MLSPSPLKIHEPRVTGVSPRPTDRRQRQNCETRDHRLARSKQRKGRQPVTFLARWPAEKAMRHARERIRELTRFTSKWPVATVVDDLNLFLRGWAAYFRFGHSYRQFAKIRFYAAERLALLLARRHGAATGPADGKCLPARHRPTWP